MVRITFPPVLQRHVACPPLDVAGGSLRAALEAAFAVYPRVRGYLLDDGGALRAHITVLVDGVVVRDRSDLAVPLVADARIDVLAALSGG